MNNLQQAHNQRRRELRRQNAIERIAQLQRQIDVLAKESGYQVDGFTAELSGEPQIVITLSQLRDPDEERPQSVVVNNHYVATSPTPVQDFTRMWGL